MMYFSEYEDYCTTLKNWRNYMIEHELEEMKLFEAKIERNTGYFWCLEYDAGFEVGDVCGTLCQGYDPRNGKNGICRHYRNGYSQTNKVKTIKL